jgi:hypothetical protein
MRKRSVEGGKVLLEGFDPILQFLYLSDVTDGNRMGRDVALELRNLGSKLLDPSYDLVTFGYQCILLGDDGPMSLFFNLVPWS